jgi:hypothetical protein
MDAGKSTICLQISFDTPLNASNRVVKVNQTDARNAQNKQMLKLSNLSSGYSSTSSNSLNMIENSSNATHITDDDYALNEPFEANYYAKGDQAFLTDLDQDTVSSSEFDHGNLTNHFSVAIY